MKSQAHSAMSPSVKRSLTKLGGDINVARRKRGLTIAHVAEAASVSVDSIRRLEAGDSTISIGILAMVLLALGESGRLGQLIDVGDDTTGLVFDEARLPKRVRVKKQREPQSL